MKKKLVILLLISSIFILAACGNTETSSEPETAEENTGAIEEDAGDSEEDAAGEDAENSSEDETDVSENMADIPEDTADIPDTEENSTVSENDLPEAVSETADSTASDEGVLYAIKTSAGGNLGMVPIVNGNAVVLMDGSYASTYQGDYAPEEMSALTLKLEEETAQALSSGVVDAWAFYREAQLRDFEFPEGVTSISKFAFARSGLNSITIPDGVTSIGYSAFYHCDNLSEVSIPVSVTTIEENAFSHTPWLENWMAGGKNAEDAGTPGDEEMTGASELSDAGDFLIVGDGVLLAYRGSAEEPELPPEVKSIVPGALGE